MSAEDKSPETDTPDWVPSPEQPSPGAASPDTTEFDALVASGDAVPREGTTGEQIGASAGAAQEAPPVIEGEGHGPASSDAPPGPLGGLLPPDRPELVVAVAFAGGVLAAILLRSLVRR